MLVAVGGVMLVTSRQSKRVSNLDSPQRPTANTANGEEVPSDCAVAALTPAMAGGPFYKAGSPNRYDITGSNAGLPESTMVLQGYVYNSDCEPIANAWLDFWQTNLGGEYDSRGYNFRGHQYTDELGRYILYTVVPGGYGSRTAHIHVKVRANEDSPILTTQLFFPGQARNQADAIFDGSLIVNMSQDNSKAWFNFVLDVE